MPASTLYCYGVNHRTAPVAIRERIQLMLAREQEARPNAGGAVVDTAADRDAHRSAAAASPAVANGTLAPAHGDMDLDTIADEWALLSTCNRFELYIVPRVDASGGTEGELAALQRRLFGFDPETDPGHTYRLQDADAVRHLCRVSAGLDSQILGESEVLGQVASAHQHALASGTVGPHLRALFGHALRAGKRARGETCIGRHPASISSVAVAMAEAQVGDLARRKVVIVGMGRVGRLGLEALRARGVRDITVVNRTPERAAELVAEHGVHCMPWERLEQAIAGADIVLTATSAGQAVLEADLVGRAISMRATRPLVIIDLAVPRDVDPAVGEIPGVRLLNVDDLQAVADESLERRRGEIGRVEAIIDDEVLGFEAEQKALAVRPVIADFRRKAERIRERELERTLRCLGSDLDPAVVAQFHHLSRTLVNQLLHEPTVHLKRLACGGQADVETYADTVRALFGLRDDDGVGG